ncbi:DUF4148 domain-containing protein [Diaphorobacter sp. C33]|uniref:Uncharacterized protein DUF4148 n=1 Tax=Diaphorobacter nitroreducens TaxID=164759 RepID=A0AAX1WSQ1_9BURK|nr:DUF4148 domain-containing protein [Diaphorobacter sp. C33]ROR41495.1 uncharacterized protein DUF4148 [Diaphorobacter nitroreducens]WKK90233.1 DUF4148 domain-containing protein [Diaphorobacter sp. C33]
MTGRRPPLFSVIASVAAVAALGLPTMAFAGYWHPANNEAGVVVHPEHFKSDRTREQVRAETVTAVRQDRLSYGESSFPEPAPSTASTRTRQQVIDEMRNETSTQHRQRQSLYPAG